MRIRWRGMECRFDTSCSVSPATNSCATCRLNEALWERCLVMAFILRNPSIDGQSKPFLLSTARGALQSGGPIARRLTREGFVFNPLHYLALLERKIGALDQAAPLVGWDLPEEFATLRRLIEARMAKRGKREFVQ